MKYSILVFTIFFLQSCNILKTITSADTNIPDDFSAEFVEPREGSYISNCISDGDSLDYQADVVNFQGISTITTRYYAVSSGCSSALYADDILVANYYGGYGKVTLEVISRDLTPAIIAASLNGTTECGFNDWADGVSKDVLGIFCFNRSRSIGQKLELSTSYDDLGNATIDGIFYQKL